jgi:hypothetical protein
LTNAFIGIDVAFAKGKRLPICICTRRDDRLVPVPLRRLALEPPVGEGNVATLDEQRVTAFAHEAVAYVDRTCRELRLTPKRIAIDAPSSPRADGSRRRAAEAAMDRAGISCFTTPSVSEFVGIREKVRRHLAAGGTANRLPHANQLWMIVGFALFRELERIAPCIEVFPQATARVLGSGKVHKSKTGGIEAQLEEAAKYTGWPSTPSDMADFEDLGFGDRHDRLDAYLSAWVAALEEPGRLGFGTPPHDVIWTPRIGDVTFEKPVTRMRVVGRTAPSLTRSPRSMVARVLLCPGCQVFEFKQWPAGWDAHAAHRCAGLSELDPEARKAEFKRRFGVAFGR